MHNHPAIFGIAAYWIFSSLVGGMPPPGPDSSMGYVWLHNSLHILAGNVTSAMMNRFPALSQVTEVAKSTTVTNAITTTTAPKE
jgi:hypothetical protein